MSKKFSNGDWKINVKTVGELIKELERLPKNLPIHQGFSESVDVVVFNRKQADAHIAFDEGESW